VHALRIGAISRGMRNPNAFFVALVAVAIFAADQFTKYAVVNWLGLGGSWSPVPNLPGLLTIIPGINTGTACGYLPQFSTLFTFAPFLILAVVILFYRQQQQRGWLLSTGTGLIIGGAFGNLADRLRLGYVVDFVQLSRWPVFNVADAAVSTAVVLLLFWSLREDSARPSTSGGAVGQKVGTSFKLALSFLVLLGILAAIGVVVCVYIPSTLPR
jgi:signal peptidase II